MFRNSAGQPGFSVPRMSESTWKPAREPYGQQLGHTWAEGITLCSKSGFLPAFTAGFLHDFE